MRPSGRTPDQMRELRFEPGFTRHAEGSCLVSFGDTRVLVTASVEEKVPPFLRGKGQGWVTAEYACCRVPPTLAATRGGREQSADQSQRLSGLVARVVDLQIGRAQGIVDCDVIQADEAHAPRQVRPGGSSDRGRKCSPKSRRRPIRSQVDAVSFGIYPAAGRLD